ncbi:MAG: iron-containing alcohol dehydrogenase [Candidatus Helarchaeota archaeon]
MISSFSFSKIPYILFGAGNINKLSEIIPKFGKKILLVTGRSSLKKSGKLDQISQMLDEDGIEYSHITVETEPSPDLINESVTKYENNGIQVVVSIGGGSVLDAGKAISAMLLHDELVEDFLEGVGNKIHDGKKIPFIAVPTTSGTGSEATKNAVLSRIGPNGFKKSLRHDNLVPNYAIIDPELMISCPSHLTASCGMDAFTQLLESYVSTKANPITDSLAYSGLKLITKNLVPAATDKSNDIKVRSAVAYAALISGITLANAGLGTVHGFASAIGGHYNIPHGVICGTLMGECNRITIELLKKQPDSPEKLTVLRKYACVGALLSGEIFSKDTEINYFCEKLIEQLKILTDKLKIKKLGAYGITENDIDKILKKVSNKNNPVSLPKENIRQILLNRL